ncbi:MAG: hypothetical protein HS111_22945 [Kofleriaceae bacterium]|nr:hypothetical protein [Kofleriaceae bacterium]
MSAEPTRRLPRIVDGALDAAGCDLDHLERELGRLARLFDRDHQGSRLPPLPTHDLDPHVVAVVVGYTAAAPVWAAALSALAGLDAAVVVTGCRDFATWDAAVAAPLAAWSVNAEVDGAEPPLRELRAPPYRQRRHAARGLRAASGASARSRRARAGRSTPPASPRLEESGRGRRRAGAPPAASTPLQARPRPSLAPPPRALAGRALAAGARPGARWSDNAGRARRRRRPPIRVLARARPSGWQSVAAAPSRRNAVPVAAAVAGAGRPRGAAAHPGG